jgi:hypothetical protein
VLPAFPYSRPDCLFVATFCNNLFNPLHLKYTDEVLLLYHTDVYQSIFFIYSASLCSQYTDKESSSDTILPQCPPVSVGFARPPSLRIVLIYSRAEMAPLVPCWNLQRIRSTGPSRKLHLHKHAQGTSFHLHMATRHDRDPFRKGILGFAISGVLLSSF